MTDDLEKYDFGGREWVAHARAWIRGALAGHNLREIDIEFCEEYTDPPEHLAEGADSIGWHLIIDHGRVTIGPGVIDARTKIVGDYDLLREFALIVIDTDDGEQLAEVTEMLTRAVNDGKLSLPTEGRNPNLLPQLADLHNEMAVHTR